ncbi:HBL/NHE enterotoxin family protein [Bacillus sp. S13(2024)]|uniref:non-hemolytic enterotoxin subunit B n=1 Tax=unclassified Bacillus (in: firmicutes) TaxID=185979 RepID=UPI003D245CD9
MTKKPYKVMALSTLIAAMAAGGIMPSYASAAENITKPAPIYAKDVADKYAEYSLGPEGLKDAVAKTGSNVLAMDLYALTILKQANANFNDITAVKDDLKSRIIQHQGVARGNANHWLDDLKPQLIGTNQNIINYNAKFQNYYDSLVAAVDNKDKATLANGLTRLSNSISANKAEVDKLVKDLKDFRTKLTSDTQGFKTDANEITSILASQDSGVPLLEKQISTNLESINKNNAILISASVATALGPIAIIGGAALVATGAAAGVGTTLIIVGVGGLAAGITGVVLAKQEIDRAQGEIQKLTGEISSAKAQVVGLTNLKKQTESLTETVDLAINALQNISNKWETMGAKYKNLLRDVNNVTPEDLAFVKEDLKTAKDSWSDVKKYAEDFQGSEIKVVEDKM